MNAGLYIHVPWCVKKCRYCDFYSLRHQGNEIASFIDALCKEITHYENSGIFEKLTIKTIYIGGGTPSILSIQHLEKVINLLHTLCDISSIREWTIECNPESLTRSKMQFYYNNGINRISLGIQSMQNEILHFLGRPHSIKEIHKTLESPLLSKFKHRNADIMYGLPFFSSSSTFNTLQTLLSYDIFNHISCYEISLSPHSPLGRHHKLLSFPSDDELYNQYRTIISLLSSKNFSQYELSNFAQPNHQALHNTHYWNRVPYLGIGPSAHSFMGNKRWWNVSSLSEYTTSLHKDMVPIKQEEQLTNTDIMREIILLGLRTSKGINTHTFQKMTGTLFDTTNRQPILDQAEKDNLLIKDGHFWRPTSHGLLKADALARLLSP